MGRMLRLIAVVTLGSVPWVAGCGAVPGPLSVSWRFVDGRSCSDTGTSHVTLAGPISCGCGDAGTACECRFTCQDGEHAMAVVARLTSAGEIAAAATTPVGGVLYRGASRADAPGRIDIDLFFTAGR